MKKILFKPNLFKEILRQLLIIPAFAIGFFGADFFKETPQISPTMCITVVLIGIVWTFWAVVYGMMKRKKF